MVLHRGFVLHRGLHHSTSPDRLPQSTRFNMLYVPRNARKKLVPAADLDYGIEEHKAGQALGPDFGVRHSCAALFGCSLVLSCFRGNPIPKRRRVAAITKAFGRSAKM